MVSFFLAYSQDMVREEYITHAERHTPCTPGVFNQPSSAKPSPLFPSPSRASELRPQLPLLPCQCGYLVNSVEELESWVLNSMPHQFPQGKLFSTAVYDEMRRTLEEEPLGLRHTVAIIQDDGDSRRMSDLFMDACGTRHNHVMRMCALYPDVYVIIGDFDECTRPRG
jgi:hypothetical protein